jgi:hypothetical protein
VRQLVLTWWEEGDRQVNKYLCRRVELLLARADMLIEK